MPWPAWLSSEERRRQRERQRLADEQSQSDWLERAFPRGPNVSAAEEEQLWNNHVRQRVDKRFNRNLTKAYAISDIPYGDNVLANNISAKDVITLESVNPDTAVYLRTNLAGGAVKQLYDFEELEKILQQPIRQSPITRKQFEVSNVRRVRADAVRNILAKMPQ